MRVRLRVRPGDFGDIEFDSFTGMLAVLDGMTKSLTNTDWLTNEMTEEQLRECFDAIEHLKNLLMPLTVNDTEDVKINKHKETEVTLSYGPVDPRDNDPTDEV